MPRTCRPIVLTVALLMMAGCHAGTPSPDTAFAPVPGNVLPSPNAFDYYAKAGAALRDTDKLTATLDPHHPIPPAAQEHLVRENAPALALLRQGFAFAYTNPAQRSETETWPYYSTDRQLASLLHVEGHTKAARGDWNRAVQSDLDAVRLGQDIPRGGVLIGMLVGVACQSIGRRNIWDSAAHLSAPQAKAAARRLQSIAARRVSYSDVMQQEEYFGQSTMQTLFHDPNWRTQMAAEIDATQENNTNAERTYIRLRLALTDEHSVYDSYTRYLN